MRLAWVALSVVVVVACAEPPPELPAACAIEERRGIWIAPPRALDLLVVVDRTSSMTSYAEALPQQVRELASVLATVQGGLPDLHLAVVTTDVGGEGVAGCTPAGDAGRFDAGARCGGDGGFLRRDRTGAQNFPGTLGDAWACLIDAPASTCPVNQPLAAIVAALDGSVRANDGFRRAYAELAILIITDADDCSLVDADALAGAAGEATVDVRCASLGTALADVEATVRHVRETLADRPDRLTLAAVIPRGATRLRAASSSERSVHVEITDGNWSDVLVGLSTWGPELAGNPCFGEAIDRLPEVPGIQAECTGVLSRPVPGGLEPIMVVPWCADADHAPGAPCLRLVRDEAQCPTLPIAVALEHDPTAFPAGALLDVRCAAECR